MSEFVDKTLVCVDCGQEFVFTSGQQEFFQAKGFTNEPKRCDSCRAAKKAAAGTSGNAGPRVSSASSQGGRRELFTAVCAGCGKTASVPFKPTGSKPVYCSSCFERKGR